jgi:uncharacterized membrane protein YeiH
MEHSAVAVFAVSGVLAARGKRIDLFGALVLALVTAFGGGTARDLLLGDLPVAWIRDATLLLTATATAVVGFFMVPVVEVPGRLLVFADACGLALVTIIGTEKALGLGAAPTIAITLGVVTGVAGGILRDVLVGEIPLVFRRDTNLYATAALCGAAVFVALESWLPGREVSAPAGAAVILGLRLAAIRWKIVLPELR